MARLIELLDSLTEDDGINPEFVDGVREAYTFDIDEINAANSLAIDELNNTNTSVIAQMTADHSAEIDRIKNERFDSMQNEGDSTALPESVGEPIEEEITLESYWEVEA